MAMMTSVLFASWIFNPRIAGIREWFLGYVVAFVNIINFVFKPLSLPVMDVIVTQSCLVGTGIMACLGVYRFVGKRPLPIVYSLMVLAIVLLSSLYYLKVEPNINVRFAVSSIATGLFLGAAGLVMFKSSSWAFPARILFAGALLFHGGFMLIRPLFVNTPSKDLLFSDLSFGVSQLILMEQIVMSVLFTLGIVMIINERVTDELNIRADRDFLTNLLNRGAFIRQLKKSISFSQRSKMPISLMIIDVDHFKSINDQHGHSVGDLALIELAKAINRTIRIEDTAGRLGGEEFAIMLPNTSLDSAAMIAERLRQNVADTIIQLSEASFNLKVSIGVSSLSTTDDVEAMIGRADRAMYAAKSAGRNLVECESFS